MSQYTISELKAVMPQYGLETYTAKIQIQTEEGKTKWIDVPAEKLAVLKQLVESF